MELRELIKEYRREHGLSQRQFAEICGLSNGSISLLEKGENPKTGQPVTPTLQNLKKIADGMGITVSDLFGMVDDIPVEVNGEAQKNLSALAAEDGQNDPLDIELASLILQLSHDDKLEAMRYLQYLASRREG